MSIPTPTVDGHRDLDDPSDATHAGLFRGFILRNSDVGAGRMTIQDSVENASIESDLVLRDAAFNRLLEVALAPVPAARGVTQVRWRARLGENRPGTMAKLLGVTAPFAIRSAIDGAALRVLKPSASIFAEDLRHQILEGADHA